MYALSVLGYKGSISARDEATSRMRPMPYCRSSVRLRRLWTGGSQQRFFSVVKRRPLTALLSLLSDSINYLQKLKGTGDTVRKQVQDVDEPVKGLRERLGTDPPRVTKRSPLLKRTYELFGSLLTNMDRGGKNGSKSAERSSPTPLTMVGVDTTRDRTALLRCSETGVGMGRTPWLGCRSS